MVDRGAGPLGFVSWRRHRAAVAGHYWEIGIAMLPGARGQGNRTEAQRLLARYLFAHTTAHRIEARTEAGNVAERRALEKAGFTGEGISPRHRLARWRMARRGDLQRPAHRPDRLIAPSVYIGCR